MRNKLRVLACAMVLALSATGAFTSLASAGGADIADANAMSALVTKVAPATLNNPQLALAPDGGANGGTLKGTSSNGTTTVAIPGNSSGQVSLESTGNGSTKALRVGLPAVSGSKDAVVAGDGTVTFGSKTTSTSVAIRAFDQGVRIHVVLWSTQADSEYSYPVDMPEGGTIQTLANGGLVFADSDNSLLGGFAAPWAKDSDGRSVPTHYEIRSNTVVQIVEHKSGDFKYPVVADPYLGVDLIDHAEWVHHDPDGWTLEVTPTEWARSNGSSYLVGTWGWDELYARYQAGLTTNLSGMRDQYICHQQIVAVYAPDRPTWNIDEWRPDVGWLETINSSCNPGGPRWFD